MASHIHFELVSPERLLISQKAAMVTIPGGEGDYGIMAGHAPMITNVRAGVIEIYADNDNTVTERLFVAGGFAEVTAERCTLLAEVAMPVAQIDIAKAVQERSQILSNLASQTLSERALSEKELSILDAKISAVQSASS